MTAPPRPAPDEPETVCELVWVPVEACLPWLADGWTPVGAESGCLGCHAHWSLLLERPVPPEAAA